MSGPEKPEWGEATRLAHAGDSPETRLGAAAKGVSPPIQRASTVLLPDAASLYAGDQRTYGRMGLGVQAALEAAICELEHGLDAKVFSSGAAAITAALMAVLSAGDEVLVSAGVYAPTRRLCNGLLKRFGVSPRYFHPHATVEEVMALAGPNTRAVFLESPASLTFEFQDVPAICAAARARGILSLIDNTWGAGVLFKPLDAGVDLSIQALTKYASGGSDVFMGSVATRDSALADAVKTIMQDTGWAVSPDDCYTVLRSLRTLPIRMARHGASALDVARWIQAQPEVARVLCPALPDSPDHALWRRDFSGLNGLFGLVLKPAPARAVAAFLDGLRLFGLGFSWGGFESLAVLGDPQVRNPERAWADQGALIRLHVGLEDPKDLIADLRAGLDAFAAACEER
ncbi:MAG: cystathionine beta-lyase [Caulobacteraceae bacterium]